MKGAKHWPNTWTEIEDLGDRKRAATISVGHRVFFDKADGNKPKKHKLTDNRPDHVLIQSAKCCVEVHPYYAKYFDVQHKEVRLYEERWVCQRLFEEPDEWRDVDAYNPIITVEEYSEPAGDVVKVTITYDTAYGILTVEYFQRDGNTLKHNVTFQNTSGLTKTFRVLQRWAGIVGTKVNGKDFPVNINEPFLAFRKADGKLSVAENLSSMLFNPDGSAKADQCLQRPISIETHAQGMKADFTYGNWVLAQDKSLEIDPDAATLDNPTEDGYLFGGSHTAASCNTKDFDYYSLERRHTLPEIEFGGIFSGGDYYSKRGYVEWDISSLAGNILTANPVFKYHGETTVATTEEINPITEEAPFSATDTNLYDYIASGTAYVDPFNVVVAANQSQDLGASAKTDLQNAMNALQSWFAIGLQAPGDECADSGYSSIYSEDKTDAATPKPTLYVEYRVGWTGKVSGVTNPAKVMGVDVANIAKVKGVASA